MVCSLDPPATRSPGAGAAVVEARSEVNGMQPGGARTVYDELLQGAVDLHCHVDLEFSATRFRKALPEWEWLPRAEAAGMRAVVLKSHLWPSVSAAPFLAELYRGSVAVRTGVTLNPAVGGLDPWTVEAAA